MLKLRNGSKNEKGFTLIELLVVAAIIGILLAIAIPNLLKARISANEASARKSMQTLRDAEGEYFEQDLNEAGGRDFTGLIGTNGTADSLRQPGATYTEADALIDSSFETADIDSGTSEGDGTGSGDACADPKAGYCITGDFTTATVGAANTSGGYQDFGWEASPTNANKTGRRDYSVYGNGVIRCTVSTSATGAAGTFEAGPGTPGCD